MIKLTYAQLNNNKLTETLTHLSNLRLPIRLAYRIAKLKHRIDKEVNLGRQLYATILEDNVEKGEGGQFIFEGGAPKLKEGKTPESYEKSHQDFMNVEVELPFEPIDIDDLAETELTPNEIMSLEPLLSGMAEWDEIGADEQAS